ncbi:DUF6702 family protein [Tautonia sociabilis]|uniref:Uncharacterized protein n=1 Tax=Tautonia sociabilis TaxID=2080755 RepID=A0A432MFX1_9BACT|nr:DUF6702 family protein [Tautonia sociabilis]RUL85296.1 hypothetical protein TsocGM_19005 [Tautonia sociabilis]
MTRRTILGALTIAAAVGPAVALGGEAHPFHITIAEADYNADSGTLEVALRVYNPGDLEAALGRRAGERVDLERTENVDALILAYLKEALVATPPGGDPAPICWVGKEVTLKTAWLYFEIPLPDGPEGVCFTNTLLFEVEPDQVNTIVFGRGKDRASLRFSRDHPSQTFRRPDPAPSPDPGSNVDVDGL